MYISFKNLSEIVRNTVLNNEVVHVMLFSIYYRVIGNKSI